MQYTIIGKPIPLQRPRFTRGRVWDSQKDQKRLDWFVIQQQHSDHAEFVGPLHIEMEFIFELPRYLKRLNAYHHAVKPDLDNLIKYVCDVGQIDGLLFNDDSIISSIAACKKYGPVAKTVFTIRNLEL